MPELAREISPLRDLKAGWRIYRVLRERRPDVAHALSSERIAPIARGMYAFVVQELNLLH